MTKLQKFLHLANEKYGDKYDYSNIEHVSTEEQKLHIVCPTHGAFYQTGKIHLRAKHGCSLCGQKDVVDQDTFLIKCAKMHGDGYTEVFKLPKLAHATIPSIIKSNGGVFLGTSEIPEGIELYGS